jgi:hypothetical protein
MKLLPLPFAGFMALCLFTGIADVDAQGISSARDGNGNLVERGAATRSYPVAPMANSAIPRPPPMQGYVVIKHGRAVMIRSRR